MSIAETILYKFGDETSKSKMGIWIQLILSIRMIKNDQLSKCGIRMEVIWNSGASHILIWTCLGFGGPWNLALASTPKCKCVPWWLARLDFSHLGLFTKFITAVYFTVVEGFAQPIAAKTTTIKNFAYQYSKITLRKSTWPSEIPYKCRFVAREIIYKSGIVHCHVQ